MINQNKMKIHVYLFIILLSFFCSCEEKKDTSNPKEIKTSFETKGEPGDSLAAPKDETEAGMPEESDSLLAKRLQDSFHGGADDLGSTSGIGGLGAGDGSGQGEVSGRSRRIASVGDSSRRPGKKTSAPHKGNIAFYVPVKILENTATNISVIISKDSLERVVKGLVKTLMDAEVGKNADKIRQGVRAQPINIYPKMKVDLKFSSGDFEELSGPGREFLEFDSTTVQREWDWVVKPKKTGNLQLVLIVSAYNESNGDWILVQSPPRVFNVVVQVDPRSYFVKLWAFLGENPEWLFIQILFPLIAYFMGRKKGKKEKSK